jgi:hypothetical protein
LLERLGMPARHTTLRKKDGAPMSAEEISAFEEEVRAEAERQWHGLGDSRTERLQMGAVRLEGSFPDTEIVLHFTDPLREERGEQTFRRHLWSTGMTGAYISEDGRPADPPDIALMITTWARGG